jgi:hypothetical protein
MYLIFHSLNRCSTIKAYSQSRYPKGLFNEKLTARDYFGFLLHLQFS